MGLHGWLQNKYVFFIFYHLKRSPNYNGAHKLADGRNIVFVLLHTSL
jgi:hypothetical protein